MSYGSCFCILKLNQEDHFIFSEHNYYGKLRYFVKRYSHLSDEWLSLCHFIPVSLEVHIL